MPRSLTLIAILCHAQVVLFSRVAKADEAAVETRDEPMVPAGLADPVPPSCNDAPPPAPPPVPRFVATLDDFGEFTTRDKVIAKEVAELSMTRRNARAMLIMGLLSGGGAFAIGTALARGCEDMMPKCNDGSTLKPVGVGLALVGVLTWWAFTPSKESFTAVLNKWNARHPTEPIYPY